MSAQEDLRSTLPDPLRVPPAEKLAFQAHGVGSQVYSCKSVEGKYAWTLKGPDAQLLTADGQVVGRHFAGPTWEAEDGSRTQGRLAASVPSPDPASIPWLRLNATGQSGTGKMSRVTSILRLHTKGGKAPAGGCDDSHVGAETRIPYEADYYFYSATDQAPTQSKK